VFSLDAARKMRRSNRTGEKVATDAIEFQASEEWAKDTPLRLCSRCKLRWGAKLVELSADTARRLWRIEARARNLPEHAAEGGAKVAGRPAPHCDFSIRATLLLFPAREALRSTLFLRLNFMPSFVRISLPEPIFLEVVRGLFGNICSPCSGVIPG